MKKTQFNAAELAEINAIQEQRSITRKSAIRVFEKDGRRINLTNANKKAPAVAKANSNPMPITVAAKAAPAVTALPDVKSRAANDDTNKDAKDNRTPLVVGDAEISTTHAFEQRAETPGYCKCGKPEGAAIHTAKKAADPKVVVPQTAAGAARGEGIRLYKLSNVATLAKDEGTTTKALFQHVYGPKGHTMTWEQRAKAVGLATAEEAAKQFQRMRGEKAGSCIVVKAEPKPEKK